MPLLKICESLQSSPARTLMVGDSSYDAQAANAVGQPEQGDQLVFLAAMARSLSKFVAASQQFVSAICPKFNCDRPDF